MKRRIFVIGMTVLAGLGGVACSPAPQGRAPEAQAAAGWVTPPQIEAVERTAAGLTVRGRAAPQGRVVLRAAGGTAYAVGADANGRFDLQVRSPANDTLFLVETQDGQDASPAPYRMLVSHDPAGPTALLSPGAPTKRLDPAGPLDVVDSDGHALLASGRATAGSSVAVSVAGRAPTQVRVGADGRWSLVLTNEGAGAAEIVVAGRRYAYPGPALGAGGGAGGGDGLAMVSNPQGWSVSWPVPPRSRQGSWFPAG
ncbi:hypothetical protein [Brevundimonas goettingensis]|uniref:Bacterial Ig domain-containing protein n=1 Tax=Brevundimonas goettingensis TaxID=2774190 RepID=A0A975C2T1_9CAUL|nr:hypothetical protein [Brevundimonas goettingensis]QTC92024.1 hypothetical protein IFJ75_03660 [Brevundimonas goettingensis]